MRNDSEQRSLPPTIKKLRDARRKGQVWQSRDMVTAAVTIGALGYLWLRSAEIRDRLERLVELADQSHQLPFRQALELLAGASWDIAVGIVAPLAAIVAGTAVAATIAVTRGLVFAAEPIKPKAERVNPVEGFKRIFSLKNLFELLKSLAKTALLAAILPVVALTGLDTLLMSPQCGIPCVAAAFGELVTPVIIAAAAVFLGAGLIDLGLQRWFFLRDMRMTVTEMKRERKDLEGDPLIRGVRRRYRRELVEGQARIGVRNATLIVTDGGTMAVGLRFVRGETPAPVVVCKGSNDRARTILDIANDHALPIVEDSELVRTLAKRTAVGGFIPQDLFHAVARLLTRAKAV